MRGVRRVVEEGRSCVDILVQLAAIRLAVGAVVSLCIRPMCAAVSPPPCGAVTARAPSGGFSMSSPTSRAEGCVA